MIAPYQRWWWMNILLDDDGNHPDPGYDLPELMAEQLDIPQLAARRVCVGAKNEGILKQDEKYDDLVYDKVNHVNKSEMPDWVKQARDLIRYGVITYGTCDMLIFNSRVLIKRASIGSPLVKHNKTPSFRISENRLINFIQQVTTLNRSEVENIIDMSKGDGGGLNFHDGTVESDIIDGEMEGVSKIKEW